jgi:hypothetical protein
MGWLAIANNVPAMAMFLLAKYGRSEPQSFRLTELCDCFAPIFIEPEPWMAMAEFFYALWK